MEIESIKLNIEYIVKYYNNDMVVFYMFYFYLKMNLEDFIFYF